MRDKMIIILLIVSIILVLLIMGWILVLLNGQADKGQEEVIIDEANLTLEKETKLYEVEDKSLLFSVESYIKETLNMDYNIYVWKLYMMERVSNATYFTQIITNQKGQAYLIVNLDYGNNAYEIKQITEKEFNDALNGKIDEKYTQDVQIKNNGNNKLKYKYLSEEDIAKYYFEMIKDLSVNYPEVIYERLTEDYKKEKFDNSYEKFVNYCNKRKEFIKGKKFKGYAIISNEDNKIYECRDTAYNIDKIIERNAAEFTIELDDYTILSEEFLKLYDEANVTKKVSTNVEQFIKIINNQDYTQAYELLNESFKNSNFSTQC